MKILQSYLNKNNKSNSSYFIALNRYRTGAMKFCSKKPEHGIGFLFVSTVPAWYTSKYDETTLIHEVMQDDSPMHTFRYNRHAIVYLSADGVTYLPTTGVPITILQPDIRHCLTTHCSFLSSKAHSETALVHFVISYLRSKSLSDLYTELKHKKLNK